MLSTPRRGISYPDPNRTDQPDVAVHLGTLAAAEDVAAIYAHGTKAARPAASIEGKFYLANDTTPHQLSYDEGSQWLDIQVGSQFGTRAARPAVGAVPVGSFYYATDQIALYLNDGSNWIRVGDQPGDVIWTLEGTRTGYLICTGQAWPGTTGIYADLFAKWGAQYPTVLPDFQGREFVTKGTHADINANGLNDGIATVADRRPKHKSSIARTVDAALSTEVAHAHNTFGSGHTAAGGGTSIMFNASNATDGDAVLRTASTGLSVGTQPAYTVGPQTGHEPTDSGAYIVLQPQVKL